MNNNKITILMYHYVRDLKHSRYVNIKGLEFKLFQEQIKYLKKHYHFIDMEMLINSIDNNTPLPKKSILLTFDDAYADHFKYVFPLLNEYKIQGAFYPPARAILEHTVLDVNKVHFILASVDDKSNIINEIKIELSKYRASYNLEQYSFYFDKLAKPNRFDTAEVIFIKRLLQSELDESLRRIITNNLFEKFVGIDETTFSRELYMDIEQIKCMQRNGMHIGSHGYDHYWLGYLAREVQKKEIEKSLSFLEQIGNNNNEWTMCYPYGNYNDTTIELLKEFNCKLALTTKVNIANIQDDNKYTLPRLDTNDMPKSRNAVTNNWYTKG